MTVTDFDPVICVCMQITENRIIEVIRAGATDVPAVRAVCGANTVCGSCQQDIEELLADTLD